MRRNNLYSYLLGGLVAANLTPEIQQDKLNLCGRNGWELVAVRTGKGDGNEYLFSHFKRPISDTEDNPRFDSKTYELSA
jgi:hypothetical protein